MVAFRLQAVLNVRRIEEERLQGELAHLSEAVEEAERKLNYLRFQKTQGQKMFYERQLKGLKSAEISMYETYLNDLASQILAQKKLLKELRKRKEEKRLEVVEASKRRKILEKLKERELVTALREEAVRHQNFIDEMGIARFVRKVGGGTGGT